MILHLFPKSKFTEPFIYFIECNFKKEDHFFVLYSNGKYDMSDKVMKKENVIDFDKKTLFWLWTYSRKFKKVVFHNLSVNIDVLFLLYFARSIVKKSAWFIWGSDLYCYRNQFRNIGDYVVERIRKSIIRDIPIIASWISADCRLAKEWYNTKAVNMPVSYYDHEIVCILNELRKNKRCNKTDGIIRILLGNSATETNHHIEMLDFLSKWSSENTKIYAPLSYGNKQYGDTVEKHGISLFHDNFIPIRTLMDKTRYFEMLSNIDIVIFNHDRQQALGNIIALLYLGKKVYMRNDTTMWDDLVEKMGFKIFTIEELEQIEFYNLCDMDENDVKNNYEVASKHYCVSERVQEWEKIFDYELKL